jgi:AcrR family transcriptional regulator
MDQQITSRQFEIIAAAGRILTTAGLGGLTIKNLAKEMKFSESAIYRHFSSKEQIIVAMLDYLAANIGVDYKKQSESKLNTEEKFTLLFTSQMEFFQENPHFIVAVFSDGLMEESQSINDAILRIMNERMKHLRPIIQEGQNNGLFINTISENDLMHIVMGSIRLLMFKWRVGNFELNILTEGNKMIQTLLTLIKTKSN